MESLDWLNGDSSIPKRIAVFAAYTSGLTR